MYFEHVFSNLTNVLKTLITKSFAKNCDTRSDGSVVHSAHVIDGERKCTINMERNSRMEI